MPKMRVRIRIYAMNSVHTYLTIWVNGEAISKPGAICLRNDEVCEFIGRLIGKPDRSDILDIKHQMIELAQSEWKTEDDDDGE